MLKNHRMALTSWRPSVVVRVLVIAIAILGAFLFEAVSSASTTSDPAAITPAIAPILAPGLTTLKPLASQGMRSVESPLTPSSTSSPQPAQVHLTPGPLPGEADKNAALSTNWSGQELLGGTYTGIEGQWTVPSVVQTSDDEYSASWIGIDGVSASSLIQTGTTQQSTGGTASYFAWVELLPDAALTIPAPVGPGDVMQALISESSLDSWTITLDDLTQNWTYSGSTTYSTPGASAEWIEEAPTVNGSQSTLANFGSATFSNMATTGSSGRSFVLNPIFMSNQAGTAIIAYPGQYESSTDSFTDYFGTPPPVVTSLTPNQGTTSGGSLVTISGDFLENAEVVAFGSSDAQFGNNNNGTITALTPPGSAGIVDVAVTTPGGTSALSSADQFSYQPPAPPGTTVTTSPPPVSTAPNAQAQHGYWLVGGDGGIFTFGSAQFHGSTGNLQLQRPVVGITPTQSHNGYWLDASDGGIFSFGDAGFYGSIPGLGIHPAGTPGNVRRLNAPVVGMVPSADGAGYFMVASDGGVFAFGDATFEGSCPGIGGCSGAAVAVMPDASGNGYWLVTATGHVYTFGDAPYYGAPGPIGTVTSAVRTPDGNGYWILFSDGRVAPFGDASGFGGLPAGAASTLGGATAIFSTADGNGYWIGTADGAVYDFGDAPNDGSMLGVHLNAPIIAGVGW